MENIINVAEKKLGVDEFNLIKDKLNKFGLIVRKIEDGDNTPLYGDMPIKSGVFSITLVKRGNSIISINDSEYEIKDNSLLLILPNYILKHKINKQINASGYVIILSIDFLINVQIKTEYIIPIFLKFYNNPIVKLTDKEIDILCKYFDLLSIEENENLGNTSALISSGIITSLIYRLSDIFDSKYDFKINDKRSKSSIRIFKEFLQLAIKEFRVHREITYYANALCVTPKYLSTIVKEVSKNKASKWIELLVITEAKSLLKYSDKTIQEIAYSLNFPNPSFFGAYFKKYAGLTPGEYRKS